MNRRVSKLLKKVAKNDREYKFMKKNYAAKSMPEKQEFWFRHKRDVKILKLTGRRQLIKNNA